MCVRACVCAAGHTALTRLPRRSRTSPAHRGPRVHQARKDAAAVQVERALCLRPGLPPAACDSACAVHALTLLAARPPPRAGRDGPPGPPGARGFDGAQGREGDSGDRGGPGAAGAAGSVGYSG